MKGWLRTGIARKCNELRFMRRWDRKHPKRREPGLRNSAEEQRVWPRAALILRTATHPVCKTPGSHLGLLRGECSEFWLLQNLGGRVSFKLHEAKWWAHCINDTYKIINNINKTQGKYLSPRFTLSYLLMAECAQYMRTPGDRLIDGVDLTSNNIFSKAISIMFLFGLWQTDESQSIWW